MSPQQTAAATRLNLGQRLARHEAEYAALQARLRRWGWAENERGELVPPPVQCPPPAPQVQRWCPRCSQPFDVTPPAPPHLLCPGCSASNPDKRVRRRFLMSGRR